MTDMGQEHPMSMRRGFSGLIRGVNILVDAEHADRNPPERPFLLAESHFDCSLHSGRIDIKWVNLT